MSSSILGQVSKQRELLKDFLYNNMFELAEKCAPLMSDPRALDELLDAQFHPSSLCKYLWVLDHTAQQITATVARNRIIEEQRGRDRAARPYIQRALMGDIFYLSEAYISRNRKRPSLTSVQTISDPQGNTLGFLGADFDLRELPHTASLDFTRRGWQQLKGDPAIRSVLFSQKRVISAMD